MPETGTQMSPVATPTPVTITNGIPTPNPVSIPNGGQVQFTNADSTSYMLEFWTKGNDKHPAVSVVIPAGDDLIVQANPGANDNNTTCNYNVLTLAGGLTDPADGGSHSIIIGSGNNDDND
ncbi:MAG TPA: hypothetical protein VKP58_03595 [Candidatus Acidoferrum sp.]|nr:hypothetical protein [Candidatus Acidoferrum sp.]